MGSLWQNARLRYADLGALLCLALMHAKLCYGLDRATDLGLESFDEAHYLRLGIELLHKPAPVDGLFYYVWYWWLHHAIRDPVALYVDNRGLLLGLPAYVLYGLLRRLGHCATTAWLTAGLFLISPANVVTWPFITRFALCLVLLCGLVLTLPLSAAMRAACVLVASFVLGYVRPEYMPMFVLSVLVALGLASAALKRRSWRRALGLAALIAVCVGAAVALGNPYSLARSRVAFTQHFAFVQSRQGAASGLSPWHDAAQVVRKHFGRDLVSLSEAFSIRPRAVAQHVLSNARTTARAALTQLFPYHGRMSSELRGFIELTLAFLGLRWLRHIRRRALQASDAVWAFLACYAAAGLGSAILLFPRDHYLLIPICVSFAWAAELLRAALPRLDSTRLRVSTAAVTAVLLLWLTPYQLFGPAGLAPIAPLNVLAPGQASFRNRLREIAALPARAPLHVLSAYPDLAVFMPLRLQPTQPIADAAADSFTTLLQREHIELVWWDEELARAHRFAGDATLARFLQNPERYGFDVRATSLAGERMYLRHGVLHD